MQNVERTAKEIKDSLKALSNDIFTEPTATAAGMDYMELLTRFGINMLAVFILIRLIYYPTHKNKDFLFTFFIFNFIIFTLLSTTKLKPGFAFGLLAIFSIMRYRTVTVPIKEMGYFFICLALGMINALSIVEEGWWIVLACNLAILLLTVILDRFISLTHENVKEITYERVDLIQPEKRAELMDDLMQRTGLPIHRVEIKNINFLRDSAKIHIFYHAKENENTQGMTGDDD
ncbi:MAG: DUF4956 domain-containing protein [Bacteroidetes bacterium]|jgi:hypothetical protein|nr:DUF4956 domain-containing protein [Bacteroidota bacterium]HMT36480.1 DUF4956 domain-containing protein [Chitinophagaceae bacterium]MBK6819672.1 DUF4956 domain-containing protein [Bacteroidota bacterium]MBK7039528.1 DUF4956 domain-containing protein [Bacteroidota bacterium]MBK8330060.1 DUF4956 domain-containing protein [Bacteroidota bacterium]